MLRKTWAKQISQKAYMQWTYYANVPMVKSGWDHGLKKCCFVRIKTVGFLVFSFLSFLFFLLTFFVFYFFQFFFYDSCTVGFGTYIPTYVASWVPHPGHFTCFTDQGEEKEGEVKTEKDKKKYIVWKKNR